MDQENKDPTSEITVPANNPEVPVTSEIVPVIEPGSAFIPSTTKPPTNIYGRISRSPTFAPPTPPGGDVVAPKPTTPITPTPVISNTPAPTQTPPAPLKPTNTGAPNPEDVLLPTKEIHSPTNAQRVSAGVLLAQEKTASLVPENATPLPPIPTQKVEPSMVQPLETYQGDIAKVVKEKNVSVVSIASAEAQRRDANVDANTELIAKEAKALAWKGGLIVAGIICATLAFGIGAYLFIQQNSTPSANEIISPFISVDGTETVTIEDRASHQTVIQKLTATKNAVQISLGLVERILPAKEATSTNTSIAPLDAQTFLPLLAPRMPEELYRTTGPTLLLGVHAYAGNQPFLILQVDSYEQAFSGMLAWETHMHEDLSPLFDYTPPQRISTNVPVIANTTTAPASSSTPSVTAVLQSGFVDKIIENRDARVIENDAHDTTFLWTFLDKKTIVITTNPYTLREIIARLKNAPTLSIPQ